MNKTFAFNGLFHPSSFILFLRSHPLLIRTPPRYTNRNGFVAMRSRLRSGTTRQTSSARLFTPTQCRLSSLACTR